MITVVLIAYNNPEKTERRWKRDVRPAVEMAAAKYGCGYNVVCMDNSADLNRGLCHLFAPYYYWNLGDNYQYGPSINAAVRRAPISAFVLYVCTQHGRMIDPSWACDLLDPMIESPDVGMTGCLWGSNSPGGVAAAGGREWVREKYRFVDAYGTEHVPQHVQGGVFAARTELLLRFPYPADYPHLYTDHLMTWAALKAGYRCMDVPSVRSVWRDTYPEWKMDGVKYLHDESPDTETVL